MQTSVNTHFIYNHNLFVWEFWFRNTRIKQKHLITLSKHASTLPISFTKAGAYTCISLFKIINRNYGNLTISLYFRLNSFSLRYFSHFPNSYGNSPFYATLKRLIFSKYATQPPNFLRINQPKSHQKTASEHGSKKLAIASFDHRQHIALQILILLA